MLDEKKNLKASSMLLVLIKMLKLLTNNFTALSYLALKKVFRKTKLSAQYSDVWAIPMMMKTTYIPQVQNTPPTAYKYAAVNCFSQNKNKSFMSSLCSTKACTYKKEHLLLKAVYIL